MKNQSKIIKYLTQTFCLVFGLALALPAVAADRWFDGGTTNNLTLGNGASQGSPGFWNNTLMNWDQGSGLAHVAWNSGNLDTANFALAQIYSVTNTDNITAGGLGLTQVTASRNLTILGAFTLTLGGNNPAVDAGTAANSGLNIGNSANATILAGTHGLIKNGAGFLTIKGTGSHTLTGGFTVNAGLLTASYAESSLSSGLLASANDLTLQGGTFSLVGKNTSASSQTLGNLIFGTAVSRSTVSMTLNPSFSTTLQMNSLVRTNNAQLQYTTTTAGLGGLTCTTLPTFVNGVVPWMTVFDNGSVYRFAATNSGGYFVTNTPDSTYPDPTTLNTGSPTGNYDLTSAVGTTADNVSVNTLRLTTTGGITTNSAGKSFTVNGLLNAVNSPWTISGDPITIGSANELVLNAPFPSGITINSVVQDNGSNPSMLTAGGVATPFLTLNANNTYSGTTTINGANVYNASGSVVVNSFANTNTASSFGMNNTLTLNGATIVTTPASAQATDRSMKWIGNCGIYNKSTDNNVTFNGRISGTGTCNIDGTDNNVGSGGFVILGGDNDYSGEFQYQQNGWLTIASANAVSNATLNVNGLHIQLTQSGDYPYNIGGLKGNFALDFNLGSATAGTGGGMVNLGWNNQNNAYQGALSGTCGLVKKGTGTQTLVKCSYTGDTIIESGTLKLGKGTANAFTAGVIAVDATYPGGRSVLTMGTGNTTGLAVGQVVPQTGGLVITAIESSTKVALNSSTFTKASYGDTFAAMDGSLASPNLVINAGATFDVSAITSYALAGGTTVKLANNGTASRSAITGNTVDFGSAAIVITNTPAAFSGDTTSPSLAVTASTNKYNNNTVTVCNATATPLGAGTYRLITHSGVISGAPNATVTVTGSGLAPGMQALLAVNSTNLNLVVFQFLTTNTLSRTSGSSPSTYGDSLTFHAVVSPDPGDGSLITFTVNGTAIGTATTTGGSADLVTGAVGYTGGSPLPVTAEFAGSALYSPSTGSGVSQQVDKTPLTITANGQSKIYGTIQATPVVGSTAFSSSALQNSETIGSVTLTYGAGALPAGARVGSTSTITPSAATGGTFATNNYTITYNTGTLNVTPRPVVLTGTRPYDATNTAAFTILSVSNRVGIDAVSLVSGTAVLASKNAGTNAITSFGDLALDSGIGTNYTLIGASGFVVLTPKALSVAGLSVTSTNKFYDAATSASGSGSPALGSAEDPGTGNSSDGIPYTGDAVSVTGTPGYAYNSKDVLATTNILVSGLSLSGADTNNYSLSQLTFAATISPAALTVTADNDSKTYGQTKSYGAGSTAFTHGALQDSETLSTVTIIASGGTNATDNAGNYDLTPSSALGGNGYNTNNYAINYVNGTLTVNPATPIVTVTVGSYTNSGFAQGPTAYTTSPAGDTGAPTWSYVGTGSTVYGPSASRPTDPGSYTATVSLAPDGNFNAAASAPTAFTINVNTTPTSITFTVSGGAMNLSWPADHLGWHLQCQTNTLATGLGTTWFEVAGSASMTSTNVPLDTLQPSVFYRLVFP